MAARAGPHVFLVCSVVILAAAVVVVGFAGSADADPSSADGSCEILRIDPDGENPTPTTDPHGEDIVIYCP